MWAKSQRKVGLPQERGARRVGETGPPARNGGVPEDDAARLCRASWEGQR